MRLVLAGVGAVVLVGVGVADHFFGGTNGFGATTDLALIGAGAATLGAHSLYDLGVAHGDAAATARMTAAPAAPFGGPPAA